MWAKWQSASDEQSRAEDAAGEGGDSSDLSEPEDANDEVEVLSRSASDEPTDGDMRRQRIEANFARIFHHFNLSTSSPYHLDRTLLSSSLYFSFHLTLHADLPTPTGEEIDKYRGQAIKFLAKHPELPPFSFDKLVYKRAVQKKKSIMRLTLYLKCKRCDKPKSMSGPSCLAS